jgi:hypothetical protein
MELKDKDLKTIYLNVLNEGKGFNEKIDLNKVMNGSYTLFVFQNEKILLQEDLERTK